MAVLGIAALEREAARWVPGCLLARQLNRQAAAHARPKVRRMVPQEHTAAF